MDLDEGEQSSLSLNTSDDSYDVENNEESEEEKPETGNMSSDELSMWKQLFSEGKDDTND